jgi:hypothetical protein
MRYIKVALLTIVFCLGAIILLLLAAFVWAQITKEKPKTVSLYSEDTTLVDSFLPVENTDKVVHFRMPKNMRAGFVYPSMEGYTKNTADCIRGGKTCEGFIRFEYTGNSRPYLHHLNAKLEPSAGYYYGEYDGLKHQGRVYSRQYYHGDIRSVSCFGDDAPRRVVYICSGFSVGIRTCRVLSPATADGFYFDYIVNEKFLTDWQTLHNKTCGLLRSFVVK